MRSPLRVKGWCEACHRYAETLLTAQPLDAFKRGAYGKLIPAQKRKRPYLCFDCLRAFRIEAEEDVIARRAREAAAEISVIPEEWGR